MKRFLVFCLILALSLGLPLPAFAQLSVTLDGQPLTFDVPPQVVEGRTLVPLRAIFESLGASVAWEGTTQTVIATQSDRTISLTIGNAVAYVNGVPTTLDVPGRTIRGRTMVPLRFVGEGLGADVSWDRATQRITISRRNVPSGTPWPLAPATTYMVTRVIDGDTIEVDFQGKLERVRLIGVDTPEVSGRAELFGKEASEFTKMNLEGKQVRLEFDLQERDRFGRLLAYVWLGNTMFNETLLREGFAQVATYPPNVKYVDRFTTLQKEAREAGKGLWGAVAAPRPTGIAIASVDLRAEAVVIKNNSNATVYISRWTLVSEVGKQRFVFPDGTKIPPGGSISVVSGPNATAGAGRLLWTRTHIWNNESDPAVLLNQNGEEVSRS